MREALLVFMALCGGVLLAALWVWNVVFNKSLRKMVFTIVGIVLNRDATIDPNAPIEPLLDEPLSHILEERAAQLDFEKTVQKGQAKPAPPKAFVVPDEENQFIQNTSDQGWPRELDPEIRKKPRPFREIRIRTENEESHPIMDVDTFTKDGQSTSETQEKE